MDESERGGGGAESRLCGAEPSLHGHLTLHPCQLSQHRTRRTPCTRLLLLLLHAGPSSRSPPSSAPDCDADDPVTQHPAKHSTTRSSSLLSRHHGLCDGEKLLIPLTQWCAIAIHTAPKQHTVASRFLLLLSVYEQRGNATSCSSTATALITSLSMRVCVCVSVE